MPSPGFDKLVSIMARLRAPGGCPWDREQTLASLRRYLIEETYEVLDAIEREDWTHLAEELGDLQLQIVFQAQIAAEEGRFTIDDVLEEIHEKLIRRHPHVFGTETANSAAEVLHRWEEIKAQEKKRKKSEAPGEGSDESILDGIPRSQPAMLEARAISKRAAKTGFDWQSGRQVLAKLKEEVSEYSQALRDNDSDHMEEELGDLLFTLVNLARHARVDPELALRRTNRKFRERFASIERELRRQGTTLEASTISEMERLWQQAKIQQTKAG